MKLSKIFLGTSLFVLLAASASPAALAAPPANAAAPGACSVALSGQHSATASCTPAAVWRASDNRGAISLTSDKNGNASTLLTATLSFPGEPTAGATFTETSTGFDYTIQANQGNAYWVAAATGKGYVASQAPAKGTVKVTITSVSVTTSSTDSKVYTAHGTLDATLPPLVGTVAKSNVTLHATF